MLSFLEKRWPLISIALLALLLACLLLWPEAQGMLSLVIIIISVGMLLVFTIHRRLEENHKGLIDRTTMNRLIILDCAGILLVLVSAMYVGSLVSKVVGEKVFAGMQESAPQWAERLAILSSLLAALVAGVGVGWLVRSIWGRLKLLDLAVKTWAGSPDPRPASSHSRNVRMAGLKAIGSGDAGHCPGV